MKLVIRAILAIFVTASFLITKKIPVTFAKFANFSTFPFLLYKTEVLSNLLFLLFLPYLHVRV